MRQNEELVHGYGKDWFAVHSMTDYLPKLSLMKKEGLKSAATPDTKDESHFMNYLSAQKRSRIRSRITPALKNCGRWRSKRE